MTSHRDTLENTMVLIGAEGADHVLMTFPPNQIHRGWLEGEVEIRADGWYGRLKLALRVGELRLFAEAIRRLSKSLTGRAKLDPTEPNLVVSLSGNGKGQILVDGTARNHFHRNNYLTFQFEIDQTFLDGIADSLERADPPIGVNK